MMSTVPPRLGEALGAFPWRSLLFDLAFVVAWVLTVSVVFRTVDWPVMAYYGVVFGGVLLYSLYARPLARRVRG